MKDSIIKKSTAQVLDRDGDYNGPGQENIAILLLSAKSNHPLGIFSPDYGKVNDFLIAMTEELENPDSQDLGCKRCPWCRFDGGY